MLKSKDIFNIVYSLGFILCFFIMFVIFFIPDSAANIYVGFIFWMLTYILCLYANPKRFISFSLKIFKLPIVKLLFIFLLYISATSLVHVFLGYYQGPVLYYIPRIYKLLIAVFAVYFFPACAVFLKIKMKHIIRLLYFSLYFIFIWGIIQYFVFVFHLDSLNVIFDFFTNARFAIYYDTGAYQDRCRAFSVFNEPGVLGKFVFLMMPFVFHFVYSKYKLVKNYAVNLFIKWTFLPVMLLALLMTKSAFWVPVCTVEFFIFLFRFNFNYIKRNLQIFVPIIGIFLLGVVYLIFEYLLLQTFDEGNVITRVIVAMSNIFSLEGLVQYEPSLAGRIISIVVNLKIFAQNIFFGIGFPNVYCGAKNVIDTQNIPMTMEMWLSYYSFPGEMAGIGLSPIYTLLAETGIFGALLFIIFELMNIFSMYKISKKMYGISKMFVSGLFECLICLYLLCFYTTYLDAIVFWLLFGLSLMIIYCDRNEKKYIGEVMSVKYIKNDKENKE